MEKILIRLEVPAIPDTYDVWVPVFLKIKEVMLLLVDAVEELSDHIYKRSGTEQLCNCEKKRKLNQDYTLKQEEVLNGQHLLLL